ncbi:MAG: XrtN system VIT domain-containing protein [Bacteroidota bacterium]
METLAKPISVERPSALEAFRLEKADNITLLGYLLLAVSTILYAIEESGVVPVSRNFDEDLTIFFIHYLPAFIYAIILMSNRSWGIRRSWQKENIHKTIILLNLFLVSAYALNRKLPVFAESVQWLCVLLVLMSVVLLTYHYLDYLPKVIRNIHHILLGAALVLYLYMSIYVSNFYLFGAIGVIIFGIGAHIFVPLLLLYTSIRLTITTVQEKRIGTGWIVVGGILTILVAIGYGAMWRARVNEIDRVANQSVIHADTDLPVWVKVAGSVKNDWLTQRILRSRLVYSVSNNYFQVEFFPQRNWEEQPKHDPLVFIASSNGITSLSQEDKKNILKTLNDSRHLAQDRLWSGANLSTSYIVTDVDIYPALRIAYSEQYINIRNNSSDEGRSLWWDSQEAIYTFQLPEGSVVTSLSLWIGGKEEKAILTSKQQAAQAYNTIVGRRRDPSVVHWQEGNTVSVRVFPCTRDEERKFKIGITSPLSVVDGKVIYKNVTFKGPGSIDATQTSRVRILGEPANVELPDSFTKDPKGDYIREGKYDPDLAIAINAQPIKDNHFTFDGYTYSLSNYTPALANVSFKNIYLDLNKSWTLKEIEAAHELLNDYHLYTYFDGDLILLTTENWKEVVDQSGKDNFSLFPFHHLKNTDNSLVITKGDELSPQLKDFQPSEFAKSVGNYFESNKKVYVFGLDGTVSNYVRSLRELRAFNFAQGDIGQLTSLLKQNKFPITEESSEKVLLHESGMIIEKKPSHDQAVKNNAPDHLARLFAYNDIMRQVGPDFFSDNFINEPLVNEASSAYVVSPVSSLVVLESKEDYERFGIKDKENSLHNASKDSSGAVPEPHEWALIIVFLLFIFFQVFRYSRAKLVALIK